MPWDILYHADFEGWIAGLDEAVVDEILARLRVLEEEGPRLGRPYVDSVKGSEHGNMKELRVQVAGEPWRILFAFGPGRAAVLLVGGNKAGDKRWYKVNVPIADERFRRFLFDLKSREDPDA